MPMTVLLIAHGAAFTMAMRSWGLALRYRSQCDYITMYARRAVRKFVMIMMAWSNVKHLTVTLDEASVTSSPAYRNDGPGASHRV